MVERPMGRAVVIVCVLRVAFLGRRHMVLGGCLDFCHRMGTAISGCFHNQLDTGCSLVGTVGVLTISDDVV